MSGLPRDGAPPRSRGTAASVATLLGQGSRRLPLGWRRYRDADGSAVHVVPVSLAGELEASLPQSLPEVLAEALGVSRNTDEGGAND